MNVGSPYPEGCKRTRETTAAFGAQFHPPTHLLQSPCKAAHGRLLCYFKQLGHSTAQSRQVPPSDQSCLHRESINRQKAQSPSDVVHPTWVPLVLLTTLLGNQPENGAHGKPAWLIGERIKKRDVSAQPADLLAAAIPLDSLSVLCMRDYRHACRFFRLLHGCSAIRFFANALVLFLS